MILSAQNITVSYRRRGAGSFKALDNVSLSLSPGKAVGLIGESGSGKTTLARVLTGLQRPEAGTLELFSGEQPTVVDFVRDTSEAQLGALRRQTQMIFQDAVGALNPRQTVFQALDEALRVRRIASRRSDRSQLVLQLLEQVGMSPEHAQRFPRELSGGQCQRVCIARALAVRPSILIADEPVSALDVSVQARILKLLAGLCRERNLALLLISHDLAIVDAVCQYAIVLREGCVVEQGEPGKLFRSPGHPYTQRLLEAIPSLKQIRSTQSRKLS